MNAYEPLSFPGIVTDKLQQGPATRSENEVSGCTVCELERVTVKLGITPSTCGFTVEMQVQFPPSYLDLITVTDCYF